MAPAAAGDAAPLDVLRYEELLPRPLDAVRALAGIEPPKRAHPGGIVQMPVDEAA